MTAEIAIPRPISEAAERLAQQMSVSLSELYTAALSAYVTAHQSGDITELLNQIYDTEPSSLEPELVSLQLLSIGGDAW